jgi:hypothetical protein
MSIDFFPCDRCQRTVCDAGPYIRCNEECCKRWCTKACAEKDGMRKDEDDDRTCNFCREEDVDDEVLLPFLLGKLGITIQEAKEMYLSEKPNA